MNYKSYTPVTMILVCVVWRVAFSQSSPPQQQAGTPLHLPIAVDGSATPDRIPDSLAYRHFLTAIAAHPFPSALEQARQAAQLAPIGLTDADRQLLISALTSFRTQLDGIQSTRAAIKPGVAATAQLSDLRDQESALAETTRQNIQQSLTTDGISRLDQYVKQHVKARIKIYGTVH